MQKTVILVLSVLVLSVFTTKALAKTQMLDVIHLTDGGVVIGEIIEIIPNQTVKLKTHVLDNSYQGIFFLQEPDEGELKIYPFDQIEKMSKIKVKFRNRTTATVRAALLPSVPCLYPIFPGWGQFYNGQQDKGIGFLMLSLGGIFTILEGLSDDPDGNAIVAVGVGVVIGSYIWSVIDANLSAKKINQSSNQKIEALKQKKHQSQDAPTSLNLNYILHQGLMASYGLRF
ncbi:hypothetical protein CMK18_17030 [Candidatus Poribacteria bacterium]|nr:hypothetical protein [Candidatus Poribacteria bacterium]